MQLSLRVVSIFCGLLSCAHGLQPNTLFSFGPVHGDTLASPNDDLSSPPIHLDREMPFYNKIQRTTLFANNNGIISFGDTLQKWNSDTFPLSGSEMAIAPFWADVDTRPDIDGENLYFRKEEGAEFLSLANEFVHTGFMAHRDFQATNLIIITWDRVGYYFRKTDKLNTFQCVLITDGRRLFTLFLYKDIQWTTGDTSETMGTNGLNGVPAQIGFNAGDGVNSYTLPLSQTTGVVNITKTSNIGLPGAWVFLVSGTSVVSGGCVENQDTLHAHPTYGSVLGGDIIAIQGCLSGQTIMCEFDGVQTPVQATPIRDFEVVCVTPPLLRVGQVVLRVMVDGVSAGEISFTSVDVEHSHTVDIAINTNTLSFTSYDTLTVNWSPELFLPPTLFPTATPTNYRVDIILYELDLVNNQWTERTTLLSNTANDGTETIKVTEPSVMTSDIAPVVIKVVLEQSSISSLTTPNLYSVASDSVAQWSAQYYYEAPAVANINTRYLCEDWYNSEPNEIGQTLLDMTLPCPPRKELAQLPNSGLKQVKKSSFLRNTNYHSQWMDFFHPGAESCFKQRMVGEMQPQQECCYADSGSLLTSHPGGGRVNKVSAENDRGSNYLEDERPYITCCTGVSTCQRVYELRPSDNGTRYDPPPVGWAMGDPHFITLDGHPYTFNAHGECTLVQANNHMFTLQGRMRPLGSSLATVFTAVAAKEGSSDAVMIAVGLYGLDVFVNGAEIDLGIITEQDFKEFTVFNNGNSTIGVEFKSGAYIEVKSKQGFLSRIAVSLPTSYRENTIGLLGVYNGNVDDDLRTSDEQQLSLTATTQDIHSQFGLTWMLTDSSDSLFNYLPYQNFSAFSNSQFTPIFNPDTSAVSPELMAVCAGDPFCLYDGLVTGNVSVAAITMDMVTESRRVRELSVGVTCSPPCVNGACVSDNVCACSQGYTGPTCNTPVYSLCSVNPCGQDERCGLLAGSHYCGDCPTGGNSGSLLCQLTDTSPCSPNQCDNGGVCSPNTTITHTGFVCLCPPNFSGIVCGLGGDSPCTPNPCQNGGTCTDTDGSSYQCSCSSGNSGVNCSSSGSMNLIIIIVGVVVGVSLLITIIFILLLLSWFLSKKRKPKQSTRKGDDIMDMRPNSVILTAHRQSTPTPTGSQKIRRLSLSRELSAPLHSVIQTSPTTDSSSMSIHMQQNHRHSLPQIHQDGLNSVNHSSVSNLPNRRSSSNNYIHSGPRNIQNGNRYVQNGSGYLHSGSGNVQNGNGYVQNGSGYLHSGSGNVQNGNGYVQNGSGYLHSGSGNVQNGNGKMQPPRGTQSSFGYYNYLNPSENRSNYTQSMDLSQHSQLSTTQNRHSPRRTSLQIGASTPAGLHGRRFSAIESSQATEV